MGHLQSAKTHLKGNIHPYTSKKYEVDQDYRRKPDVPPEIVGRWCTRSRSCESIGGEIIESVGELGPGIPRVHCDLLP